MKIRDILKSTQPDVYKKLKTKEKENLTEKEIKKLMNNAKYRRGTGGAIRQVGFGGM